MCVKVPQLKISKARRAMARLSSGFSLLELLVVVAIIGILAAYVGPKYFSQLRKSEITSTKAQIGAFERALDAFRIDVGRYPSTLEGLKALQEKPAAVDKWSGPYLTKEIPNDPWGSNYVYYSPGEKADFDLLSYGKDGKPGGEGENADITN
jgi:general secretion pathway protein G